MITPTSRQQFLLGGLAGLATTVGCSSQNSGLVRTDEIASHLATMHAWDHSAVTVIDRANWQLPPAEHFVRLAATAAVPICPDGGCPTGHAPPTAPPYHVHYGTPLQLPESYAQNASMSWSYQFATYANGAFSLSDYAILAEDTGAGTPMTVTATQVSTKTTLAQVRISIPGGVTNFLRDYILTKALDWLLANLLTPAQQPILIEPGWCPPGAGSWMPQEWDPAQYGPIPPGWVTTTTPSPGGTPAPGPFWDPYTGQPLKPTS